MCWGGRAVISVDKPAVTVKFGMQSATHQITSMSWGPRGDDITDERSIAVGHNSGLVRLWSLPAAKVTTGPEAPLHEIDTGAGEIARVHAVQLHKDGPGSIVCSHVKGKLSLWNLEKPQETEVRLPPAAT